MLRIMGDTPRRNRPRQEGYFSTRGCARSRSVVIQRLSCHALGEKTRIQEEDKNRLRAMGRGCC